MEFSGKISLARSSVSIIPRCSRIIFVHIYDRQANDRTGEATLYLQFDTRYRATCLHLVNSSVRLFSKALSLFFMMVSFSSRHRFQPFLKLPICYRKSSYLHPSTNVSRNSHATNKHLTPRPNCTMTL